MNYVLRKKQSDDNIKEVNQLKKEIKDIEKKFTNSNLDFQMLSLAYIGVLARASFFEDIHLRRLTIKSYKNVKCYLKNFETEKNDDTLNHFLVRLDAFMMAFYDYHPD